MQKHQSIKHTWKSQARIDGNVVWSRFIMLLRFVDLKGFVEISSKVSQHKGRQQIQDLHAAVTTPKTTTLYL